MIRIKNFYAIIPLLFIVFLTLKLFHHLNKVSSIGPVSSDIAKFPDPKVLYFNKKYWHVARLALGPSADPKDIADMPTRKPLSIVLQELDKIDENDREQVANFMKLHFDDPGSDIVDFLPSDWQPYPKFAEALKSKELIKFSLALNSMWKDLFKSFKNINYERSRTSSHIQIKNPFVVSGGRLREMHYMDTYWAVKGLLVCEMYESAKMLIENLIDLIERFGYIPDGSRIYYLNRSQMPYFTKTVWCFYETVRDSKTLDSSKRTEYLTFVRNYLVSYAIEEHKFWAVQRTLYLYKDNRGHSLNRYGAKKKEPRVETNNFKNFNQSDSIILQMVAAAESGYDYSSRWLSDPLDLKTIQTKVIAPVDLNSLLYETEVLIAKLCDVKGMKA